MEDSTLYPANNYSQLVRSCTLASKIPSLISLTMSSGRGREEGKGVEEREERGKEEKGEGRGEERIQLICKPKRNNQEAIFRETASFPTLAVSTFSI